MKSTKRQYTMNLIMKFISAAALAVVATGCGSDNGVTSPSATTDLEASATQQPAAQPPAAPAPAPSPSAPAKPEPCVASRISGDFAQVTNGNKQACTVYVTSWLITDLANIPKAEDLFDEVKLTIGANRTVAVPRLRIPKCKPYQLDLALVSGVDIERRSGGANYRPDELAYGEIIKENVVGCEPKPVPTPTPTPTPAPCTAKPDGVLSSFVAGGSTLKASVKVENAGVWGAKIVAASTLAEYQANTPDYVKAQEGVELDCGAKETINLSFDVSGHPAEYWWVVVERNGAVVLKSSYVLNAYN